MSEQKKDRQPLTEEALDRVLSRAAAAPADPLPNALRSRLLADALAQMPAPTRPAPRPAPGRLSRLLAQLGGASGMAGLTAAGLAGFWIGTATPDPAGGLSGALWQGAALVSPSLAEWTADAPEGFEDDLLLALLAGD